MIQIKATCLQCRGMGYLPANPKDSDACPNCSGKGDIILTSQNWDITIERVPPFSVEEMEEMRGK